jgi:hypothetical protein
MTASKPEIGESIHALTALKTDCSVGSQASGFSPSTPLDELRGSKVTPVILTPWAWVSAITWLMAFSMAAAVP